MDVLLFAKDWERFNAMVHLDTRNESFLHVSRLYKHMGIKNHAFMLALFDPRLMHLDPHDPNITVQEMMMVAQECLVNPWYFFREVARAPGQAGAAPRPFRANRGNMALYWSFFNHAMTLLIQIRQTGKSFSTDILAAYLLHIRCRDTQINLLTKDETLRRSNIQRLKDIADVLPPYLDARTKKDSNNTELITIRSRNNLYQGHLPQASEKLAGNVGRGLTSPIFLVDEPPFQPNIQEALPAALAAGGAARDIALAAGEPHGTILTTTAGKKDTKEGKYMFDFMSEMAEWSDRFFDSKDAADFELTVKRNSMKGEYRVNITLNHTQLGETDAWLKKKISESAATGDAANRDYFNFWSSGTATNPLTTETLERIRASQRAPTHEEICDPGNYVVRWFIPENQVEARMATGPKVVVFDTSEASGGDDISLRVTDVETGECLAAGTYNDTNIITFSEWVATWLTRWSTTTMVVERRSTGSAVLDMLLLILPSRGIDPFKRIFNMVVQLADEDRDRYAEVCEPMGRRSDEIYTKNKKAFGFATSGSGLTSRTGLYSQTLMSAAKQVGHLVYDKKTIEQIASLIVKNGRIDHPAGGHDDMVISWLLTHWFMTKATNLRHYGIDPTQVLRAVRQIKPMDPRELIKNNIQVKYRTRLDEIIVEIKDSTDDFIIARLEHEMRNIYSRLELQENERINVDEVIAQARQERLRNRLQKTARLHSNLPRMNPNGPMVGGSGQSAVGAWSAPSPYSWHQRKAA